jgi:hypothetical protein
MYLGEVQVRSLPLNRLRSWGLAVAIPLLTVLAGCSSAPATPLSPSPSGPTPAQQTTSTPTPNPLILVPATTPSAVGVCTQQMSFGADGNAGPILCSDGAVNSLAWTYFDQSYPGIFAIGAYATESQVAQAVSEMETNGTIPTEESAYCLAKAYYGWQFGISLDPANQTGASASCSQDIPNFP